MSYVLPLLWFTAAMRLHAPGARPPAPPARMVLTGVPLSPAASPSFGDSLDDARIPVLSDALTAQWMVGVNRIVDSLKANPTLLPMIMTIPGLACLASAPMCGYGDVQATPDDTLRGVRTRLDSAGLPAFPVRTTAQQLAQLPALAAALQAVHLTPAGFVATLSAVEQTERICAAVGRGYRPRHGFDRTSVLGRNVRWGMAPSKGMPDTKNYERMIAQENVASQRLVSQE